ncbi:MAG: hypothetical protein IJA12_06730, partial [Oscillospiraceae bacterium]|nr:hypothetical protein [Oscillospiraceae bacterium]
MRITNNYMTRNYLGNLNRSLERYNSSANKLTTGRKFSKMSENVSDGTRALTIRTQFYKNEQIQDNVKKAGESLYVAESNLMSIKDIVDTVHSTAVQALNETNKSAADIYAADFDAVKEQIVEFANCKYNDCFVLGGTNNTSAPFEIKDGELFYNGVNVNDIQKSEGVFMNGTEEVPYSNSVFIDIGISMTVSNGKIDPRTAFNMSVSGLDCLGYGTTEVEYDCNGGGKKTAEVPNNVFEIIDEMSTCLREGDYDKLGALNDHLKKSFDNLVTEISDIGIRTNYLDRHTARL